MDVKTTFLHEDLEEEIYMKVKKVSIWVKTVTKDVVSEI